MTQTVSCAKYALDHDLIEKPGWKRFRKLAKRQKKLSMMINAANRGTRNHGPIYKVGIQVPRNSKEARMLDERNGNTKWADAEKKEMDQLFDYGTDL